ncbi:MFS transporter [Paenibacillus profundus]|uniref:MFS transporter n=1 Tax=Paenibacillus profundus TaxID=1173085 RepID=A0ABS8YJR1_9BACL|nr:MULTISPECIES: MFS transporter [Paenibacillus]MCE5172123.1 MFS transporter [Paenibacillus profundus]MCM3339889.1 MFS transporter [Paenibacillus sp. MER TA 81-3]
MTAWRKTTSSPTWQFVILIIVVTFTGLSQGLLLPLLTIFLERMGVPSDLNALNATALYIGVFAMMFLVERILIKVGFKRMILGGLIVVTAALALFPIMQNIWVWFVLRLVVGIGDSALHYATQLWAVSVSPAHRRGRNISLYGMAYGVGFSFGPLGINLLKISDAAPFIVIVLMFVIVMGIVFFKLPDQRAEMMQDGSRPEKRYARSYQWAWFALLPAFLYGYMEASMNSNFPVYALRLGLEQEWISYLLPFFGIGGLILQLPLGILSDRIDRKKVLMTCGILGGLGFLFIPLFGTNIWGILIMFMLVGGLVGSFFSLGLAYAADILPKAYLPSANVIASIHFSLGSIIGPNLAGLGIQHISIGSMFYLLGIWYIGFSLLGFIFKRATKTLAS